MQDARPRGSRERALSPRCNRCATPAISKRP